MEELHCTQRRGEKEETEIRHVDVETDSGELGAEGKARGAPRGNDDDDG